MSLPRGTAISRRPARSAAIWSAVCALVALVAACGGSSVADVAPYLGSWQRIDGGEPDPSFTLTVSAREEAAAVTFANLADGMSRTVPATVEDASLACVLPTADELAHGSGAAWPAPALSGAPAASDLRLSLDANGQLVVDLVLADGTLEPVWIYGRAPEPGPSGP